MRKHHSSRAKGASYVGQRTNRSSQALKSATVVAESPQSVLPGRRWQSLQRMIMADSDLTVGKACERSEWEQLRLVKTMEANSWKYSLFGSQRLSLGPLFCLHQDGTWDHDHAQHVVFMQHKAWKRSVTNPMSHPTDIHSRFLFCFDATITEVNIYH